MAKEGKTEVIYHIYMDYSTHYVRQTSRKLREHINKHQMVAKRLAYCFPDFQLCKCCIGINIDIYAIGALSRFVL